MKTEKIVKKVLAGLVTAAAVLIAIIAAGAVPAQAASGNVYTCVIHPCYAHPVTGEIEDSAGAGNYATGQGMVEGTVYSTGILELTDSGEYYLTVRLSLMDQTSGHSFWVQNVGDSGWSAPAVGVTGNGSDNNGSTADVCIQVPSENCIVRGSMYVEPMGRDVIFYLYPSDYTAGNNTDMNATIVTSASGSENSASSGGNAAADNTADSGNSGSGSTAGGSSLQGNSALPAAGSAGDSEDSGEDTQAETPALTSSIEEAAAPAASADTDGELSDAQGLSLSTEAEAGEETQAASGGNRAFAIGAAVTVSGLILMAAAAVIVYFFRKNWKRWGGGYEDDE